MFAQLLSQLVDASPDWLYAAAALVYWNLNPRRKKILMCPFLDSWYVVRKDARFFVATPKDDCQDLPVLGHSYEEFFTVEKGDIVVDAGAYIGMFALLNAGKASKIITVEMHPRSFSVLRRNVGNFGNVITLQKAIWNKKENKKICAGASLEGNSLIGNICVRGIPSTKSNKADMTVEADTLDSILSGIAIEKVDFIKMDVEGAELEALEGADNLLKSAKKIVVAAYHERDGEKTSSKVKVFLEQRGFTVQVSPEHIVYARKRCPQASANSVQQPRL